jgi:inositol phosphorylceramide mannosyltransferase catalytic subunit
MAIPKTIIQTFKSSKLPLLTRWHIYRMRKNNPEYDYQFYDDAAIDAFIQKEYGEEVFELYKKINIGAAKADFFRYAVLYKMGGIYVDIDSLIVKKLDSLIMPDDKAVIALEGHRQFYVQWALVFEAGHPFLKKTLELVLENLRINKFPYDVHKMTGPTVYTNAIRECLDQFPNTVFRQVGVDYEGVFSFSYPMSKLFLYGISRKDHWKKQADLRPVLKI